MPRKKIFKRVENPKKSSRLIEKMEKKEKEKEKESEKEKEKDKEKEGSDDNEQLLLSNDIVFDDYDYVAETDTESSASVAGSIRSARSIQILTKGLSVNKNKDPKDPSDKSCLLYTSPSPRDRG